MGDLNFVDGVLPVFLLDLGEILAHPEIIDEDLFALEEAGQFEIAQEEERIRYALLQSERGHIARLEVQLEDLRIDAMVSPEQIRNLEDNLLIEKFFAGQITRDELLAQHSRPNDIAARY